MRVQLPAPIIGSRYRSSAVLEINFATENWSVEFNTTVEPVIHLANFASFVWLFTI